jgi:8-oxo-dGTP diphosphatase
MRCVAQGYFCDTHMQGYMVYNILKSKKGTDMNVQALYDEARRQGFERLVVGAVIVQGSKVLLLRRAAADFMGGLFELPGGGVEPQESILDALAREVDEETGLTGCEALQYFGAFDYLSESGEQTRQLNFLVRVNPADLRLSPEHETAAWVAPDEIDSFNMSPSVLGVLRNYWEGR